MALVRWEPLREMATLQNEMNRLFGTFFDTPTTTADGNGFRRWIPAMDLVETDDHFVLRADLPGMGEDDVKIEAVDNVLTISGERKSEQQSKGEGYYRLERGIRADPASHAAVIRSPLIQRPRNTAFAPWRSKNGSASWSSRLRCAANGPRSDSRIRRP